MVGHIVIAGGGTSGWMSAMALSSQFDDVKITLIESPDIPTIGVGEATIPPLRSFHKLCNLSEKEFMVASSATFKLGIQFENWGLKGDKYIHSFGKTGKSFWAGDFQHFWARAQSLGLDLDVGDFCFEHEAAKKSRFAKGGDIELNYAYHLDAGLYVSYLEKKCLENGVNKVSANISNVNLNADTGYIASLGLDSGALISGDLFIDCTGFKALLSEKALRTGYESWSNWLLNDTAVAMQTVSGEDEKPYTRSVAYDCGWRWEIPLQSRLGNGFVFSKDYLTVDEASDLLNREVSGRPLTDPKVINFNTGVRKKAWNKNCIAIGLSGGFIEPLESTSIHLVASSIMWLIKLIPHTKNMECYSSRYNSVLREEMESIRDFIILHYWATERDDSEYWRYCKDMEVPSSLRAKVELFRESGQLFKGADDLFRVDSWLQVLVGQRVLPNKFHPLAGKGRDEDFIQSLKAYRAQIQKAISVLPSHTSFLNEYCPSKVC